MTFPRRLDVFIVFFLFLQMDDCLSQCQLDAVSLFSYLLQKLTEIFFFSCTDVK